MREIKFRAWDAATKEMHRPEDRGHDTVLTASANILKHFDCVMQFTGLKDKNGKDIYEGDILSMWDSNPQDHGFNNTVIWKDGAFGYVASQGGFHSFANHSDISKPQINDAYIIGNIYENPELLK